MNQIYKVVGILFLFIACSKDYAEVDPATGQTTTNISNSTTSVCEIIRLKQINGQTEYNSVTYNRDLSGMPISLNYVDSTTKTILQTIRFAYSNDTVNLNNTEWLIFDKSTKNILKYYKRNYYVDNTYDDEWYEYVYDNSNRLAKKYFYYNGSLEPDYTTVYQYSLDNNLIGCKLLMGPKQSVLLQTSIQYDLTKKIKPWIYLYGDSFENYLYLIGFKFGVKPSNPVTQILTNVFDVQKNTVIDTWKTNFSGYVTSKDNYVLQVDCNGDLQQGLGLYVGTVRFDYSCR